MLLPSKHCLGPLEVAQHQSPTCLLSGREEEEEEEGEHSLDLVAWRFALRKTKHVKGFNTADENGLVGGQPGIVRSSASSAPNEEAWYIQHMYLGVPRSVPT